MAGSVLELAWRRYLQQLEKRPLKTKVCCQQRRTDDFTIPQAAVRSVDCSALLRSTFQSPPA